jgi:putative IMPACT (imprinted ancient) family translation regulator
MSSDRYRTLGGTGTGQLREQASRFIGIAFPMADEESSRIMQ